LIAMFFVHLVFFHGRDAHTLAGAASVEIPKEKVVSQR